MVLPLIPLAIIALKEALASKAAQMLLHQLLKMAQDHQFKNAIDGFTHAMDDIQGTKVGKELVNEVKKEIKKENPDSDQKQQAQEVEQHMMLQLFVYEYLRALEALQKEKNPDQPAIDMSPDNVEKLAEELAEWIKNPKDADNPALAGMYSLQGINKLKNLANSLQNDPSNEQVKKVFKELGKTAQEAAKFAFEKLPVAEMAADANKASTSKPSPFKIPNPNNPYG